MVLKAGFRPTIGHLLPIGQRDDFPTSQIWQTAGAHEQQLLKFPSYSTSSARKPRSRCALSRPKSSGLEGGAGAWRPFPSLFGVPDARYRIAQGIRVCARKKSSDLDLICAPDACNGSGIPSSLVAAGTPGNCGFKTEIDPHVYGRTDLLSQLRGAVRGRQCRALG